MEAHTKYKKLLEVAIRVLALVPNSCSVERVCSQHKLVANKIRNRLRNKMVQMLLYCYVNMRLLNKCPPVLLGFLESALNDRETPAQKTVFVEDEEVVDESVEEVIAGA